MEGVKRTTDRRGTKQDAESMAGKDTGEEERRSTDDVEERQSNKR